MKKFEKKTLAGAALAVLTAVFAVGSLVSGASRAADDKKDAAPRPALTVTSALPSQASLPIKLAANGNITAWQEAIIGSEVNGLRLVEVRANIGDQVSKGEVLAVFAAETVQAEAAQARAALLEAEANAADAANNALRARSLQSSGALSTQQINQYLTGEKTAAARVESAKANLAAASVRLRHAQLVAPDSGVISARAATVGAVVGAGTELFRMIRQGRLEWRAEVTANELASIRRGMNVTVTAANGSQVKGTVRMVAPTVDLQTRSALVYVDLRGGDAKAGMFARGEFDLGTSSALTVPQQSVVVRDGFSYLFRLNKDSRVSQVKVKTGRRLGDKVEIQQGISAEMPVVVSGAGFLNDGDLVKNVQPAGPAAAPAAAQPAAATKPAR